MADISLTVADIRALPGAITERYDAGAAITAGQTVYIAADGDVEPGDGSDASTAYSIGIAVAGQDSATSFAPGDRIDVVVFGRVAGFTGMTPGDVLYQSDTAGALADAAGTTSHKVGKARSATVFFVNPDITEA